MSQILCSPAPVTTKEGIHALLADKGGETYYKQMRELKVDQNALAFDLQQDRKSVV